MGGDANDEPPIKSQSDISLIEPKILGPRLKSQFQKFLPLIIHYVPVSFLEL